MRQDRFHYLRQIDTETERYTLVHRAGEGWFGRMQTLMMDGSWHQAWTSETYPNGRGARDAIRNAFGL